MLELYSRSVLVFLRRSFGNEEGLEMIHILIHSSNHIYIYTHIYVYIYTYLPLLNRASDHITRFRLAFLRPSLMELGSGATDLARKWESEAVLRRRGNELKLDIRLKNLFHVG